MENEWFNRQTKSTIIPILINIILAVSLNITTGFLGELSLGHAGFMAIGAYTGALITTGMTTVSPVISMGLGMLCGGLLAAVAGVVIGIPVLRLRGDYLAIATLAFNEIVRSIINYLPMTGGAIGLSKIPSYASYLLVYTVVILTIVIAMHLKKSRHGRAIFAIKENSIAAEAMGIPVTKFKIMAFTVSAFLAGIAGVLYAHDRSIIRPDQFTYNKSIDILVFVVLGGMGSIKGSVIAAIILTWLPMILISFGDFRLLLYAIALIVIMIGNSCGIKEKIISKFNFRKKGEH